MDYSFLKLYESIADALNDTYFSDSSLFYYNDIQLFKNEPYLQITNVDGGISFDSDFTASLVDVCGNTLSDITENIYIQEFIDADGQNQCAIEVVNLNLDYYGRSVIINIKANSSNASYFTRPILVSNKNREKTYRFDYKDNSNRDGVSYENANFYQSIRLKMKFTGYNNSSEVGDYYQISTKNTISTRFLKKIGLNFTVENLDAFTFERLQELFAHEIIYLNGERVTDKPILESQERIGESNIFKANFTLFLNPREKFDYSFQIFEGLKSLSFTPFGNYITGTTFEDFGYIIQFNVPITLQTGTLSVYTSEGVLVQSLIVNSLNSDILSGNSLGINITAYPSLESPADGSYYVNLTADTVSFNGIGNDAITGNTTWTFNIGQPDFLAVDFDTNDFFTG